ncbi:MAG TPA: biotin/lipoyl-containing protein, partial [Actinoplanes sp.]|nr:biotin/lipoyl-containing protein [Actinoplanes sp.]
MTAMSRIKEFNLPDLGEGLLEGEILAWLVQVGDTVELNQPIVEVETAKAAVEIPAKWAGVITKIHHEAGTTVEVGAPIVAIDTDPGAGPLPTGPAAAAAAPGDAPAEIEAGKIGGAAPGGRTAVLVGYGPKTAAAVRRPRKTVNGTAPQSPPPPAATTAPAPAAQPTPVAAPAPAAPAVRAVPAGVLAKPPVRKLARDLGVDLGQLVGTGPAGSITRADVQLAVSARETA